MVVYRILYGKGMSLWFIVFAKPASLQIASGLHVRFQLSLYFMSLYANLLYSGFVPVVGSPGNWSNMVQHGPKWSTFGPSRSRWIPQWVDPRIRTHPKPSQSSLVPYWNHQTQAIYIYIYIQYSGMIWGPQCEESLMISHNISLDPFGSYI